MSAKKTAGRIPREMSETGYQVLTASGEYLMARHIHAWRPPTDVIEGENRILVMVEIAGMKESEIHVSVSQRRLTIHGERTLAAVLRPEDQGAYHRLEVQHGEFRVDVPLSWLVDADAVTARYEDGFLLVELPRSTGRRVTVLHADEQE